MMRQIGLFTVTLFFFKPLLPPRFRLQLYSLRNEFAKDVPGTMAKVKEMGFKNVEMAGTYALPFPDLMKLLAANELNVVSFGVDFDKLQKYPQTLADQARAYGAQYMVCFWIPHAGVLYHRRCIGLQKYLRSGKQSRQRSFLLAPHGYDSSPIKRNGVWLHGRKIWFPVCSLWICFFWLNKLSGSLALLKNIPVLSCYI